MAIAEVDYQDKWQRAALGVSCVAESIGHCQKVLQEVEKAIGRAAIDGAEIIDRTDRVRVAGGHLVTQRTEKVQKLARQVLGELIHDLKDPRIGFATVTAVRITPDLRHARVFVSVLGSRGRAEGDDGRPRERQAVPAQASSAARCGMKYLPELIFELDHHDRGCSAGREDPARASTRRTRS